MTNLLAQRLGPLLADGFPLSDAFNRWTNRTHWWMELLLMLLAVGGLAVLWWWVYRGERDRQRQNHVSDADRLFEQLCQTHRLDSRDRLALKEFAQAASPEEPLKVFVDPRLFDQAVVQSTTKSTAQQTLTPAEWQRRLFGSAV